MKNIILAFLIVFSGFLMYRYVHANNELRTTGSALLAANTELTATGTKLKNTEKLVTVINSDLTTVKSNLARTETTLSTTLSLLMSTENKLQESKSQALSIQRELDASRVKNAQILDDYASLRTQIHQRRGTGKDCQLFITPDNEEVSRTVKIITGSYSENGNERWNDYEAMYRWVVANIDYSYDSYLPIIPSEPGEPLTWRKEFWRFPEETLEDGTGDCEDMAVLLATMILNYNEYRYSTWAIEIQNGESGHLAVALPVIGDKLVIFDPAGKYYSGKNNGYLKSSDIESAISDWLIFWKQQMPDAKVTKVFSDKFFKEFSTTQEFINWAKD